MRNKFVNQSTFICSGFKSSNYWSIKRKLFMIMVAIFIVQISKAQFSEGFEEPIIPTSYTTASYGLSTGTWYLNNAKKSTSGTHSGSYSCLIGSASGSYITSPIILTAGIDSIVFWGSVSSGPATALQVLISLNGAIFTQVAVSPFNLTTTPTRYAAAVKNSSTNIQVKFLRTSTTIYLDDICLQPIPIMVPTITVTGTIAAVNTTYGSASTTPTSFSVSGETMNEGILVTPPYGFEVSKSIASGYAATITIGAAGTIAATTIYARLKSSTTAGNYAGNIVLSSAGAINVNQATVSSIVTPFTLSVSGIAGVNKIYDGTTIAAISGTAALSSTVNSDIINLSGTVIGNFQTATVGIGKIITVSGLTLTGTNSSSYVLSTTLLLANIIPLSLTLNEALVLNKTYDGTNVATISGILNGVVALDIGNVVFNSIATFSQVTVANNITVTSTSTLLGTAKDNYTLTQPIGLTANITKANQTISFTTFTTPITTATLGFVLIATATSGNTVTFVSSNLSVATIAGPNLSVIGIGTTAITASQKGDNNYFAAIDTSQTLIVNRSPVIIYLHNFETGNFSDTLYTQTPTILSDNLFNTKWSIKTGVLQKFAGSGGTGTGALGVLSGSSASPLTLYMNVQNGYSLTINSFSFWRLTSSAVSYIINVNGINIGSGNAPQTIGANTGLVSVLNPVNGLTGLVKVQLVLSGSGSFRIDDFTLNGNLISCGILPEIVTQPITQTLCESSPLNLIINANNVTAFQWRKSGNNISGATSSAYSIVHSTIADGGNYDVLLVGSTYCATNVSNVAQLTINPTPSSVSAIANLSAVCSGTPIHLRATYNGISESFETATLTNFLIAGDGATAIQNNTYFQQGISSILFNASTNDVANNTLTLSNDIDLTKYGSSPSLQFYHICALEGTANPYDFGYVEYSINSGATWTAFPANTYMGYGALAGASGTVCFSTISYTDWNSTFTNLTSIPNNALWKKETINLSSYTANTKFKIRFRITTDVSGLYYGWLIDNINIGSVPSTYLWSSVPVGYTDTNQNPTSDITPIVTTNYILTATNSNGCSTQANTIVNINPTPTVTIGYANNPFCNTADSQLVNFTNKTGDPYTYSAFSEVNNLAINKLTGTIKPALSTIGKYTIMYNFIGANGCSGSASSNIEINKIGLWKNLAADSNWGNNNNWYCSVLPSSSDDVILSNFATHYPVINDMAHAKNIDIGTGTILRVIGTLNVAGSITNSGILDASRGTIILDGNAPQYITGKVLVKNFTVNNAAGVTTDTVYLTGQYTPLSGTLNTSDKLFLVSDSSGTASIGVGTEPYISGGVTVQRYHANKRAWLLISAPLTMNGLDTATTHFHGDIKRNWQAQTYITAPSVYTQYGMDAAVNNTYAMLRWTGAAWGRVTNTLNDTSLIGLTTGNTAANNPFFLFVRGDRSILPTAGSISSSFVTLEAKGALQTGTKTVDISTAGTYALVANPYAAPISLNQFLVDNSGLVSGNTYLYYWDPNNSTTGGYTTAIYNGGSCSFSGNNPANIKPDYIQSGQAFFVTKGSVNTISFNEGQKSIGNSSNTVFGSNKLSTIKVDLSMGNNYIDGVLGMYNNSYSAAVIAPTEDAYKFWSNEEGIAIARGGTNLSVEARPEMLGYDTMFLFLNKMIVGNTYNFNIAGTNIATNITGTLIDKYLNKNTILDLTTSNKVTFSIDTATIAKAANRFIIVFNVKAPLYLTAIRIKASVVAKTALINWTVASEKEVNHYIVEHSTNGTNFIAINNIASRNIDNSNYSYSDIKVLNGNNYYRIQAVNKDGSITYSSIAKINIGDKKDGMNIYPNPMIGKTMNIQLRNIVKGLYKLTMFNTIGQQIMQQQLQHAGGSITSTVELPATISAGVYQVRLTNDGKSYSETVILK